jgi:hypothetical protein
VEANPDPEGDSDAQQRVPPEPMASTTVGTGSMLALGCVVTVILLVLAALAIRRFAGGW